MSLRFILLLILFFVIYKVIKIFIVNFRLGAKSNDNFQKKNKPKSKYDNVEEADFTEIETKEKNQKK